MNEWFVIAVGVLVMAAFTSGAFIGAVLTFKGRHGINPAPTLLPKALVRRFGKKGEQKDEPDTRPRWGD